jgi:hypothetical protein
MVFAMGVFTGFSAACVSIYLLVRLETGDAKRPAWLTSAPSSVPARPQSS